MPACIGGGPIVELVILLWILPQRDSDLEG